MEMGGVTLTVDSVDTLYGVRSGYHQHAPGPGSADMLIAPRTEDCKPQHNKYLHTLDIL